VPDNRFFFHYRDESESEKSGREIANLVKDYSRRGQSESLSSENLEHRKKLDKSIRVLFGKINYF
jgi:hypothetical protein